MDLEEFYSKHGENPDWSSVDALDFYLLVDSKRTEFQALADVGILNQHFLYPNIRRRMITDLYFLCLTGWDSMPDGGIEVPLSENVMNLENHKEMISMFVKKDPDLSLSKQKGFKTRLILYPRGTQKSSWDYLDLVQWILLDHTVRILVLTAADDMAGDTVDLIKGYFFIRESFVSIMNLFWPEHCLLEKDSGKSGDFTTPMWTRKQITRKEPTIMARGITATISGYHFEIIAGDDAVSDRNSLTTEQCAAVKKRYYLTRKTLRSFGFTNLVGTRYHEDDLYGDIISKTQVGNFKTENISLCVNRITNVEKGMDILIGAAMQIKLDCAAELAKFNIPRREWFRKAGRDGVVLIMPGNPHLTYDKWLGDYEDDPETFSTQMNQNCLSAVASVFTEELLLRAVIHWNELPVMGRRTACFDLNGGKGKKDNDFVVGNCCLWDDKGIGYIIDLVRDVFPNPTAIAKAVVTFCTKHHPDILSIEDALGSRMLQPTIEAEADKYRHPRTGEPDEFVKNLVRRIHWSPIDTREDSKRNRINSLQPLLMYGRMRFVNYLPYMDQLKTEFVRKITRGSKNDIPDSISLQIPFMPVPAATPQSQEDKDKREQELRKQQQEVRDKSAWNQMFEDRNNIWYENPAPPQQQEYLLDDYQQPSHEEGLDNILGAGLIG